MRLIDRKTVYLQETGMPMYIHEHKEWPAFSWDKELVNGKLNQVHRAVEASALPESAFQRYRMKTESSPHLISVP